MAKPENQEYTGDSSHKARALVQACCKPPRKKLKGRKTSKFEKITPFSTLKKLKNIMNEVFYEREFVRIKTYLSS